MSLTFQEIGVCGGLILVGFAGSTFLRGGRKDRREIPDAHLSVGPLPGTLAMVATPGGVTRHGFRLELKPAPAFPAGKGRVPTKLTPGRTAYLAWNPVPNSQAPLFAELSWRPWFGLGPRTAISKRVHFYPEETS